MQPTKLTAAVIRQLVFEGKPVVVRDTIVNGLMVAVNKHSNPNRVQRDLWIGQRERQDAPTHDAVRKRDCADLF